MASRGRKVPDPGLVAVLAYDGLCTFEFGIAVEIFGLPRPEFDFPWYRFQVVSGDGPRVEAIGGIQVSVDAGLRALSRARTIVVPGWRDARERPPRALCQALRRASARGARCLSICSGVFVLAAAGLLTGRKATTHWRYLDLLGDLYPDVTLERDVLYVDEGNVLTSAGSAAGIDACIHLVRRDFGNRVANDVARRLVMPPHREGGQAQYVATPVPRHESRSLARLLTWARAHLHEPITLKDLAMKAHVSPRTLLRQFKDATGAAPMEWLQRERIRHAQGLLEDGSLPLSRVAEACGFRSNETFRASFRRALGVSPSRYARSFHTADALETRSAEQ